LDSGFEYFALGLEEYADAAVVTNTIRNLERINPQHHVPRKEIFGLVDACHRGSLSKKNKNK